MGALAVNKCTAKDGRIAYQDGPCDSGSQAQTIEAPIGPKEAARRWSFVRHKDDMTGVVTCFSASPISTTNWSPGYRSSSPVYMQIAVTKGGSVMRLSVNTSSSAGSVFHLDLSDQGIKIDNEPFVLLTQKLNSYALGIPDDRLPEIVGKLQKAQSFRLRLRFWPYEKLHDTDPIPLAGFVEATAAMMKCAM